MSDYLKEFSPVTGNEPIAINGISGPVMAREQPVEPQPATLSVDDSEGRVRVDLSQLSFADESGLTFLRELRSDGVELLARSAMLMCDAAALKKH